jgi:hypothetical protein
VILSQILAAGGTAAQPQPAAPGGRDCPAGFYYHPREDDCLPRGTPVAPRTTEAPREAGGWSKGAAECVLQHIDKARVGPSVDAIVKACGVLGRE